MNLAGRLAYVARLAWVRARAEDCSGMGVMDTVDRAEAYLRRIVALTGAVQVGPYCYVVDAGNTRFEVHDSYVCPMPNVTDPSATLSGTCFRLPSQHMPVAEKVATALLQLKNNPRLFDKWACQNGLFKADGELFGPVPIG